MYNIDGALSASKVMYIYLREKLFCYTDTVYLTFPCSFECCCHLTLELPALIPTLPRYLHILSMPIFMDKECVFKPQVHNICKGKFPSDIS
jgi:hypothetical protein